VSWEEEIKRRISSIGDVTATNRITTYPRAKRRIRRRKKKKKKEEEEDEISSSFACGDEH